MTGTTKDRDHEATRRVVLERVRAIVLPSGGPVGDLELGDEDVRDVWVEVGEYTGTKVTAIEQYAGKPRAEGAKIGEWKAPSVTAWKGGVRHTQPPLPRVEREILQ